MWKLKITLIILVLQFFISSILQEGFALTYSPDGKYLAAGPGLWDGHTGKQLRTLVGHEDRINTVAFSPDGKILATGESIEAGGGLTGGTGEIRLWNPETGELLRTLAGHETRVNSVAFHPNGKIIASAGKDGRIRWGTVRLWDVETGEQLKMIKAHESSAESVTFTHDGKYIVSSGWTGQIYIWNAETGIIHQFTERKHRKPVFSLRISPDGKLLASGDSQRIVLWDTDTWTTIKQLDENGSNIESLSFHPDSHTLASGHSAGYITLWDVETYREIKTLKHQKGGGVSVAFSPKEQILASLGANLRLWELPELLSDTQIIINLPDPQIIINPNIIDIPPVGDTVSVNIDVIKGVMIAGYQLTIAFDSDILRYVSSTNGSFLTEHSYFTPAILSTRKDEVTISAVSFDGVYSGNGTLATITFASRKFKETEISLSDVLLTDRNGEKIKNYRIGFESKLVKAAGGPSPAIITVTPTPIHLKAPGKKMVFDVNITGGADITDYYFQWQYIGRTIKSISVEKGDYFRNGIGNGDGKLATVTFEVVRVRRDYGMYLEVYLIGKNGLRYKPIHKSLLPGYPELGGRMLIPIRTTKSDAIISISPASIPHPGIGEQGSFNVNITGGHNIVDYYLYWNFSRGRLKLNTQDNKTNYLFNGIGNGDGTLTTGTFEMLEDKSASISVGVDLVDSTGLVYYALNEQGKPASIEIKLVRIFGDVNKDGVINIQDLVLVASKFGETVEDDPADVNGDGVINVQDLVIVANALGNN